MEAFTYLATARQARLMALACPVLATTHKARARFWLALARQLPPVRLP